MKTFIVGISGASGFVYGRRLIQELSRDNAVKLVVSDTAFVVMEKEEGIKKTEFISSLNQNVELISNKNLAAPISSGSQVVKTEGVIVCPCSMSTLAAVANGVVSNLIHRVCDVALKERKKVVMVVREMPYSLVHIENMKKATLAGAIIMPASPGFYHRPASVDDMVNFVVGKVLDQFDIRHNLYRRWREDENK